MKKRVIHHEVVERLLKQIRDIRKGYKKNNLIFNYHDRKNRKFK